jgi:hypothetical protein
MEKKIKGREILFRKEKSKKSAPEPKKQGPKSAIPISKPASPVKIDPGPAKKSIEPIPGPNETENVVEWIKNHPLFKYAGMCKDIGVDRSNFYNQYIHGKSKIPPELLDKIIAVIVEYGYTRS